MMPDTNFSFEKEIIIKLIEEKQLAGYLTDHRYYSIGSLERLPVTADFLKPKKVIFLDRDGVINKKAPKADYVKKWSEFEFLEGAIEARKQFLLAKVYQKLQAAESNEQIHQIMGSDNRFPAPETGVYVLIGANGEGPKLSAVRVNPRYDEDKVAGLMGVLTATERGFETLRFQALEVPEVALKYIQNLKILEVRLS